MVKYSHEIGWASMWRILFFAAFALLMYLSLKILMGLFLALVISSGLEFMVNFLERRGIPRTLGVIMIFLASILIAIILVYTVIPLLIVDINTALLNFGKIAKGSWWGGFLNIKTSQSMNILVNQLSSRIFSGDASPLGAIAGIFGSMALAVSVIVSSFYLSLSRDGVERFIRAVVPSNYEERILHIYENSRKRIGYWFRSQILLSLSMGILVMIALSILGVHYAILLGLVAAVFELVPFIGPILAGSAASISALTTSPGLALATLITFVILHQIESHLLVPLLIGRSVGLHPVIVIMALLVGVETGGLLGILISVPAAVVLQEVVENWSGKGSRPVQTTLI
ncbi:MAG: AI-2E family transporter [Candidatus Liptonbacteria bacterium]